MRGTGLVALVLLGGLLAGCSSDDDATSSPSAAGTPTATSSAAPSATDDATAAPTFAYEGEEGRTVLDLLLEKDPSAEVSGEGENAYVVGIEGRTADAEKEFWALYVNGEFAQVGAGSLVTRTGDEVEWKLETY